MTASRRPDSYSAGKTIVLTLVVLPFFAVPTYFLGQGIADAFDDDRTNGVLALGLILVVTAPALLSIFLARVWGELRWIATLALGVEAASSRWSSSSRRSSRSAPPRPASSEQASVGHAR